MAQHNTLNLVGLIESARLTKKWLVLVCPTSSEVAEARKVLASALTPSDRYSGRTARLHEGGAISVVNQDDNPFHAEGTAITVKFLGCWSKHAKKARMETWRAAANEIL